MATTERFVRNGENPKTDKKALFTALFHLLAWVAYLFGCIIGEALGGSVKNDNEIVYIVLLLICLGVCVGILALGEMMSCKNGSDFLNFVLMLFFYVSFSVFAVAFSALDASGGRGFYAFIVGIPFIFVSALHLLWAALQPQRPFQVVFSVIALFVAVTSAVVSLLIHQAIYDSHIYLFLECLLAVLLSSIFSASWISSVCDI